MSLKTTIPELTRKPSTISSTSLASSSSSDETLIEQAHAAIEHTKTFLENLNFDQALSPVEDPHQNNSQSSVFSSQEVKSMIQTPYHNKFSSSNNNNLPESSSTHLATPSTGSDYDRIAFNAPNSERKHELAEILHSLVELLSKSQEQIKQLKLKNLMLNTGLKDTNSRFEVEHNINKQQFERIKCQLILENQGLVEKMNSKDMKIRKYKDRIIEKNKEINRLMRLLNKSCIPNPPSGNSSSSIQKPRLERSKTRDSNMLATLGILASHVLNEEQDAPGNSGADNTELEMSQNDSHYGDINPPVPARAQYFHSMPVLSEARPPSVQATGSEKDESKSGLQLPRLRSFNTLDGSVKEIK